MISFRATNSRNHTITHVNIFLPFHPSLLAGNNTLKNTSIPFLQPSHDLPVNPLQTASAIQQSIESTKRKERRTSSPRRSENFFGRYLSTHIVFDDDDLMGFPIFASLFCSASKERWSLCKEVVSPNLVSVGHERR